MGVESWRKFSTHQKKKWANSRAILLRRKGRKARVVKEGKNWIVLLSSHYRQTAYES